MKKQKNVTRSTISEEIHKRSGLSSVSSGRIVDDILDVIECLMATQGKSKIKNFGTFITHKSPPRMVNIPGKKKGEKILGKKLLESRIRCQFKPSIALNSIINIHSGKSV